MNKVLGHDKIKKRKSRQQARKDGGDKRKKQRSGIIPKLSFSTVKLRKLWLHSRNVNCFSFMIKLLEKTIKLWNYSCWLQFSILIPDWPSRPNTDFWNILAYSPFCKFDTYMKMAPKTLTTIALAVKLPHSWQVDLKSMFIHINVLASGELGSCHFEFHWIFPSLYSYNIKNRKFFFRLKWTAFWKGKC